MNIYERTLEKFARTPPGYWFVRKVAPRVDPPLLRISGGRFSSVYPTPVMLLTTTGAKSGLPRTLPLLYVADGDSLIYRNLKAHPEVEVLAGKHTGTYTASEITDPAERENAWAKSVDQYAGYSDYEVRAGNRTIPLIRLRRSR